MAKKQINISIEVQDDLILTEGKDIEYIIDEIKSYMTEEAKEWDYDEEKGFELPETFNFYVDDILDCNGNPSVVFIKINKEVINNDDQKGF